MVAELHLSFCLYSLWLFDILFGNLNVVNQKDNLIIPTFVFEHSFDRLGDDMYDLLHCNPGRQRS